MKQIKSFRITEANQKRLASLAKSEDRSEAWVINMALDMYLDFVVNPVHIKHRTRAMNSIK
ncbi:hypothetical protein LCGC14_1910250 [marine sediment metagenome]|uniref:Ribbon-helix-helix protein CopG domain-containing protein n=1 Tax=marine sediment metagenome TaxID=412755 RepID=A0A0F9I7T1_9ZZZZ